MTVDQPSLTTDAGIAAHTLGFTTRTLPKEEWTHAGHFAATLWLLRHDRADLEARLPGLIRTYNASVGGENTDTAGYHETITQASLRAAEAELRTHAPDVPLATVLAQLMDGRLGRSGWILEHWSRERLFSVEARRAWVEPDLRPLPF